MTISYASEVPNGSAFGCFWKILIRWKGSVYKLIWRELLVYLLVYYIINFVYRYALNEEQQKVFERIRYYFGNSSESIPMSFVLGFYVSLVVKRWWEQYKLLPWPDNLALFISAAIPGNDERNRLMRRNIVRYAVLAYVITLQRISLRVKKRFPTLQHIVEVGLMVESEKKIFEMMDKKANMSKYWMPLVWATNIINRARKENMITNDQVVQTLLVELSDIRKRLGGLIGYDTVCVPLVYTQVVTLSLYAYFLAALLGRQFVYQHETSTTFTGKYEIPDMYFPFFTSLQFCFYVGWLKVAEVLINPFGEDDDDIELNWLIDRHIKAAYMIVDEMHEEHPELLKDQYWNEVVPKELPYTVGSEHYRREEPKGSAERYKVKESDALYANVTLGANGLRHRGKSGHMQDDVYADYESVDTPLVERKMNNLNWVQRTIRRMGSVRSNSTYNSSGFFSRNRHNSVYSSPEAGQQPGNGVTQAQNNPSSKFSFYDKLRRKSIQSQRMARQGMTQKLNSMPMKNRPRIPTPDVSKEIVDRETKLAQSASNAANIGAGIIGMLPPYTAYPQTPANVADLPVNVVVVSPSNVLLPIQEKTEGTPVARPSAAHLAQAVLPQSLKTSFVASPVTVGQLTRLVSGVTTTAALSDALITAPAALSAEPAQITEVSSCASTAADDDTLSTSLTTSSLHQEPGKDDNDPAAFKRKSPILLEPGKLDTVITLPTGSQHDWNYLIQASDQRAARIEPKGRRSTSLPGPPATLSGGLQPREDRSMSLPHSLGQIPGQQSSSEASRSAAAAAAAAAASSSHQDSLCIERLRGPMAAQQQQQQQQLAPPGHPQTRPRSGSFDHTIRQLGVHEQPRKISFNGQPSSSSHPPPPVLAIAPSSVAGSKRNEVYV